MGVFNTPLLEKVCRSADGCLAKIGRDIEADFIGQARLARFGKFFTIKMEVYDVIKGTLVGTFTDGSSEDMYGLFAVIDKKAPEMFEEMRSEQSAAQALKNSKKKTVEETSIDPQIKKERNINMPFWAAVALETVGAGLIFYGMLKDSEVAKNYDKFRTAESQQEINNARDRGMDSEKIRNRAYIVGAISLTTGIGVHVWF